MFAVENILKLISYLYSLIKERNVARATSKTRTRAKSALLRKMRIRTVHTARLHLHFKGPRGEVVSDER